MGSNSKPCSGADFVDFDLISKIVGVSPCHPHAKISFAVLTRTLAAQVKEELRKANKGNNWYGAVLDNFDQYPPGQRSNHDQYPPAPGVLASFPPPAGVFFFLFITLELRVY